MSRCGNVDQRIKRKFAELTPQQVIGAGTRQAKPPGGFLLGHRPFLYRLADLIKQR